MIEVLKGGKVKAIGVILASCHLSTVFARLTLWLVITGFQLLSQALEEDHRRHRRGASRESDRSSSGAAAD